MRKFIDFLSRVHNVETLACCCGHGKYPMTLIVKKYNTIYEIFSGTIMKRKKKFYKKDKKGYYYIPEILETVKGLSN